MDKQYKFANVTDRQLKQLGVQALADRPNAAQQYGQSGLSAQQLKLWFDKLATLIANKLNELQDTLNGTEATKYIGLDLSGYKTLYDFLASIENGSFAETALKLYPNENALEVVSLQEIIFGISQAYSKMEETVEKLDEDAVKKVTETNSYRRAYGVNKNGEQTMLTVSEAPVANAAAAYSEGGALKAKMSPIEGMPSSIEAASEVVNLAFINEMRRHIGAGVKFSMDPKTYIVSVDVVNIGGQIIYHTELDLPFESVVVGGYYDDKTREVVFTLKSGDEIRFPVEKLVNGLVTEAKHTADIKAINLKLDTALAGYISDIYNIVGDDYVDYS